MAPPRGGMKKAGPKPSAIDKLLKISLSWDSIKTYIFDPAKLPFVSVAILLVELVLNVFVIQRVKYTEIDWTAYMQECEGFLNGTTNYSLLRGVCSINR